MTNIIGDLAGEYKAMIALIDKMPEGEVISVGDMIDRGPQSKEILDYFMNTPNTQVILGNHEHMMLDFLTYGRFYGDSVWLWNGGNATIASAGSHASLQKYIDWIAQLPKYIIIDDVFISHSFLSNFENIDPVEYACDFGSNYNKKLESTIIWNRAEPMRQKFRLQVCGHNSQFGLREWRDKDGLYAICLDDSRYKRLTGLYLETMTIYQQDYIK